MMHNKGAYIMNIKLNRHALQQGVVLPIALLSLLLVTLIAMAGFRTSIMQTKMAGNTQFQTSSFNGAEKSLIFAENALETQVTTAGNFDYSVIGDGYYDIDDALNVRGLNWNAATAEVGETASDKFVIQYDGRQMLPGEDESASTSGLSKTGSYIYVFRVTSRNAGLKNTERVVQSVYATLEQP